MARHDKPIFTEEQYFAAAREWGWATCDEDTPQQFCETEKLTVDDIAIANVEHWRAEFNFWKAE